MSPPIRDGSGNSIGSIRLGDGSEIAEVRTGAGDVLFSASAIPDSENLHMQYDAVEQNATDGSQVSTLVDQSGNGNDLSGNAKYDETGLNGNPTFIFDGVDDEFSTGSLHADLTAPQTIYGVYRLDDTNSSRNHHGWGRQGKESVAYFTNNTGNDLDSILGSGRVSGERVTGPATDYQTPHILVGVYNGGSSVLERDDDGTTYTDSITDNTVGDFGVGEIVNDPWDGAISAVYVYDGAHDSQTRTDVFNHLGEKYGI